MAHLHAASMEFIHVNVKHIHTNTLPIITCFYSYAICTSCVWPGVVLHGATCRRLQDALPACRKQSLGFPTFPEPPSYFRPWFPQAEVGWASCVFAYKHHSCSSPCRWKSVGPNVFVQTNTWNSCLLPVHKHSMMEKGNNTYQRPLTY